MENIFGHEIRLYPTKAALKQPVSFIQDSRCPALGALMVNQEIDGLPLCALVPKSEFFTTFVAVHRISDIFSSAAFAEFGFFFVLGGMSAARAKFGVGC